MGQEFLGHHTSLAAPHLVEPIEAASSVDSTIGHSSSGGVPKCRGSGATPGRARTPASKPPAYSGVPASVAGRPNLLNVRRESRRVQLEIDWASRAIDANVDRDRPAFDVAADDLFDLGLKHRIGVGSANGHFQMTVIEPPNLDRDAEPIGLGPRFPEAGHAQQHAGGPQLGATR